MVNDRFLSRRGRLRRARVEREIRLMPPPSKRFGAIQRRWGRIHSNCLKIWCLFASN